MDAGPKHLPVNLSPNISTREVARSAKYRTNGSIGHNRRNGKCKERWKDATKMIQYIHVDVGVISTPLDEWKNERSTHGSEIFPKVKSAKKVENARPES